MTNHASALLLGLALLLPFCLTISCTVTDAQSVTIVNIA